MDKEKALNQGVDLPSSGSSYGMKSGCGSINLPTLAPVGTLESDHFGHTISLNSSSSNHHISQMQDNINSDSSLDSGQATSAFQVGESSSSVAVSSASPKPTSASIATGFDSLSVVSEKPRLRNQDSQSMAGSTTTKPEMFTSATEKPSLADFELALSNQKEANSQSADPFLERENQYIAYLEKTVETVENERISLTAQVTKLQRVRNALAAENSELKLQLQTRKQQANLKDGSQSS